MKNKLLQWQHLIIIVMSCLPLVYLAISWKTIPDIIPLHFNVDTKPDKTGNKQMIWIPAIIITAFAAGMYFLFRNIHRIDPKRNNDQGRQTFNKLGLTLAVFLTAINFITILSMTQNIQVMNKFLFPVMGLLFAVIGNYMHNIKPNYFAGFRLPWTLNNETNWRRTHQLAGKIWFAGGLFIAASTVFMPTVPAFILMFCCTMIMVIVPAIYSFRLFKKGNPASNESF